MAYVLLEEVAINPTVELPELTQEWEIDSGRAQRNLVCTRTQEKGAVTPQETDPDLPMSVQESLALLRNLLLLRAGHWDVVFLVCNELLFSC